MVRGLRCCLCRFLSSQKGYRVRSVSCLGGVLLIVTHLGAMQHIEARLERDELLGRDHFLRLCHRFVKLGLHLLTLPGKTALFLSFPYVYPEPVLVK